MWHWLAETLRHHPEMALFLTLALGYAIGKIRLGTLPLGAVVGVLIAGVIIGQLGVKISSDLKTAFFLLFLFAIGYRTGPQFFSGLKASGVPQVALTVIFACAGLGTGYALAKTFGSTPARRWVCSRAASPSPLRSALAATRSTGWLSTPRRRRRCCRTRPSHSP